MKLYTVPNRTWITVGGEDYFLDHLDGMYSYCLNKDGDVVHISAFEEVEINADKNKADSLVGV